MKTVMFTISGTPTPEDVVILSCRSSKGGQSNVRYKVKTDDTLETIVAGLSSVINSSQGEWGSVGDGVFKAVPRGTTLLVMVGNIMDDCSYVSVVTEAETEVVDIEVIG